MDAIVKRAANDNEEDDDDDEIVHDPVEVAYVKYCVWKEMAISIEILCKRNNITLTLYCAERSIRNFTSPIGG